MVGQDDVEQAQLPEKLHRRGCSPVGHHGMQLHDQAALHIPSS